MSAASEEKDVLENWEEMDDSGLERELNKIIQEHPNTNMSQIRNGGPIRMILLGDDAFRTHPPEPTVKILKRPTKSSDGLQINGDFKPKAPIKTLQQREQEYAEARLRILGAARSPDEYTVDDMSALHSRLESSSIDTVSTHRGETPKNVINTTTKTQDTLIRMPLGPDGTKGFNIRR